MFEQSPSPAPAPSPGAAVRDALAEISQATLFDSSGIAARFHPKFGSITAAGSAAIPEVLRALEQEIDSGFTSDISPHVCMCALAELSGERPRLDPADHGVVRKMAEAWVDWGRNKGYLPAA